MNYVVYCDESRHDGHANDRYMAIGGLWVREEYKFSLTKELRAVMRAHGLNAEVKWSKVSTKRLGAYKAVIDAFFNHEAVCYRAIVVDQTQVDLARYHNGDRELGFYKFYYQMLKTWILKGNEYLVLLDFKQNRAANRYSDLRLILGRRARSAGATIKDLTVINSDESPLAQVCDLLTGAVAASCCADIAGAKADAAAYIAKRAGIRSLTEKSYSPIFSKFNIFRIRL